MKTALKIYEPSGIFDAERGLRLQHDVEALLASNSFDVILVDLLNVSFINSPGLGALTATLRMVRSKGGELYLCSLNEQTRLILELANLHRLFRCFEDREAFYKYLEGFE